MGSARNEGRAIGPSKSMKWAAPIIATAIFLLVWQLICALEIVPSFMLPSPIDVAIAICDQWDLLLSHVWMTLSEAVLGLLLGVAVGFLIAMCMDRFSVIDAALSPLVTISQTIPTVAIAPLLVLWFGYGMLPKVLLVALTTFFPITVSLSQGFKSVDPDALDLMRVMGASWLKTFFFVKVPSAMGQFFSGLRISATYAVVGAVVAEWLGGFSGLGVYMTRVRKSFAYSDMFASIIVISLLSLLLMGLVKLLERALMPWSRKKDKGAASGKERV